GGVSVNKVARWDGLVWQDCSGGVGNGFDNYANAVCSWEGNLVATGQFFVASGHSLKYIAQWNGATWGLIGPGINEIVTRVAVYNGELIAAGGFVSANGTTVNKLVRWDGTAWQPFGS